jgi:hypothetical protein
MILALALTVVAVPGFMYGVHRFERWSQDREAHAEQIRREDAVIVNHPGANEEFAAELRKWRKAGLGSAVAR